MNYKHLQQASYTHGEYKVRAVRESDMPLIKQWRNEQIDVLRQTRLLTDEDQRIYFRDVIRPSFTTDDTRIMLFGYLLGERLIGYGGLTNIDWHHRRAEISFLLETSRSDRYEENREQYRTDFSCFLALMKRIAFEALKMNRLFTETYDIRPLHISVLEQNGFMFEGRMRKHVRIDDRYVDSLIHGCVKETNDV